MADGGASGKNPPASAGDAVPIPGLGRAPGEGNGNPPQHSCLGNPMDREVWQAAISVVSKSQTQWSTHIVGNYFIL